MAPLVEVFEPSQMPMRVQYLPNGRKRKVPVELQECALQEMMQFNCELDGPKTDRRTKVVCEPVLRLFRKCANGLTVETTSYED